MSGSGFGLFQFGAPSFSDSVCLVGASSSIAQAVGAKWPKAHFGKFPVLQGAGMCAHEVMASR